MVLSVISMLLVAIFHAAISVEFFIWDGNRQIFWLHLGYVLILIFCTGWTLYRRKKEPCCILRIYWIGLFATYAYGFWSLLGLGMLPLGTLFLTIGAPLYWPDLYGLLFGAVGLALVLKLTKAAGEDV